MSGLPPRLAEVLRNPPPEFSPAAIWWWSGEALDPARLRWQLERFVAGGVHNLVILNLAPSGPMFGSDADDPVFFSERWWELFEGVCADAQELGARLWFYDQLGFSGADLQARLVQEQPAHAGQWLDRSGRIVTRGFDYLSADACAALLDRVHGEFERRVPHLLGGVIAGSFQDELPALPTWSARFAEEFQRRRGYDLTPSLPALWSGDPTGDGPRIRRDYHLTRAELAEEAFFRPLAAWHERHGLLHGCDQQDPARAGDPVDGVRLYADYARTHRWFGAPGSDHHGDARIHSSLAHLYGRPRTWIEAFHSTGWGGTLEETFDWLLPWLRSGANLYNPHAVYYTTKGGWWEWAPPSTDWRQPYWRHHKVFADAVTRLCAALSLGRHVCDVAVLLPTATAQAGTRLDGVDADAAEAQRIYRELVGDMAWFHAVPGALDRALLDADVIDDDSVRRAVVSGGRLRVADEAYSVIILPACTVLEGETAERLAEFVSAGGRVMAVGALPDRGVGGPPGDDRADRAVARLRELITAPPPHAGPGATRFAGSPAELPPAPVGPARVEAPVPVLVREVEGATLVFLTAAFPRASEVSVGRPDERGVELGWVDAAYDFDPVRYATEMRVRVRGVQGMPLLAGLFGGSPRPLAATRDGDVTEVVVPFDDAPAALLIFPAAASADDGGGEAAVASPPSREADWTDVGPEWGMELVPTLDNTWGDFALPAGRSPVLERWALRHLVESDGVDGLREGWAAPGHDETGWRSVHATFGPHGDWSALGATGDPPSAWTATAGADRHPMVYSSSRGIHKDPVHRETLGPKGHVPEEFLDFGDVRAGAAVHYRTQMVLRESVEATLALGAAAAKEAWLDGAPLALDDGGHLATAPVCIGAGAHVLDLRLTPDEDLRLRAHVALVRDAELYRRPEWIAADGPSRPGAQVTLSTTVTLESRRSRAVLQVAAVLPCRVRVNGAEIGRQGGFDPYAEHDAPRVRRYEVADALRAGDNEVSLELTEPDAMAAPAAVLADGDFGLMTGRSWRAHRDGAPVPVTARRRQYGDPAALHLWRRPHPLPEARWLEEPAAHGEGRSGEERRGEGPGLEEPGAGESGAVPVVFAVPGVRAGRVEWFRFAIPPGATCMEIAVHGAARVFVDGVERAAADDGGSAEPALITVDLAEDGPSAARTGALRIECAPGHAGGAALAGPVRFEAGTGRITLGDWESAGLAEYSGGVRYRRRIAAPVGADLAPGDGVTRTVLDLGRVRGTAEVVVNGRPVGVRVCSPYTFDVTEALRDGENEIEVLVLGTLAPYLDAVSPTHFVFPGQRVSGLIGPVRVGRIPHVGGGRRTTPLAARS
ncbi:glycosylhydrolase-like jelly roll fold domain-containing protein [Actinomadura alba]|uniref:glycosylhydrolase-like jelly roll fold domain-containing protein n=1 Tax=Actinomadura alba TaxID=406431 RepID=UPI0031DF46F7